MFLYASLALWLTSFCHLLLGLSPILTSQKCLTIVSMNCHNPFSNSWFVVQNLCLSFAPHGSVLPNRLLCVWQDMFAFLYIKMLPTPSHNSQFGGPGNFISSIPSSQRNCLHRQFKNTSQPLNSLIPVQFEETRVNQERLYRKD